MATAYTTLGGYAALILIGGALVFIYRSKGPRTKVPTKQLKVTEKLKPTKAKKTQKSGGQSSGNEKAPKKKEKQVASENWPQEATSGGSDRDDEVDNREFARQLSSAKAGTLLPSKTQEGGRQKSVKQSKAQEKAAAFETGSDVTAPSSAAGGDADDDRSSLNSPELSATSIDAPVTSGGISDMLEEPAPGPSVLRVTAPTNPTQPKKAKAPAAFEPAETKKQRQNRKKAEQKKVAREEEEKERKVLAEKQRRTAREAEGRAAKDGSTFMASKAPSSSAWTAPPATTNGNETAAKPKVDLLDTYEPASKKESNSESNSDWQKVASSMSEEEQLRLAMEESDDWEPVQGKKNKRKGKVTQSPPQEKKEIAPEEEEQFYGPPKVIAPTGPGQEWDMTLQKKLANGDTLEYKKTVQDSEWDVAGYGDV